MDKWKIMMKQLREIYLIFPLSAVYSQSARTITLMTKDDINVKEKKRDREDAKRLNAIMPIFKYIFMLVNCDWLTELQQVHWFKMCSRIETSRSEYAKVLADH